MVYKNTQVSPVQYRITHTDKQSQFYKGYSTVGVRATGSSELYDLALIRQDLLNHFNTRQGERVMLPEYGTIIWSLIFEPFTVNIKQAIADDITRICNSDPRVVPTKIEVDEREHGILLDLTLRVVDSNQSLELNLQFDRNLGLIS
jgi:phage baseplate assembly protein W